MIARKFEEQVERTPYQVAVKCGALSMTYRELNRYANRIARVVLENLKNAGGEERVSLLLEHGPHMIAAILGVLKAGKVYVPLAVDYPDNRLSYMIENSGSSLILTLSPHRQRACRLAGSKVCCLSFGRDMEISPEAGENPGMDIPGDQLAYIMYTSGSTGRPKGVMQTHENVLYYIRNWTRVFSITAADRMTLFSSFCHDGSVQDMLGALLNGAALYPVNVRGRQEEFELSDFLKREKITIWHSVHSLFAYFANSLSSGEQFASVNRVLLGGEPIREHEIDLFKTFFPRAVLANVYGQTESSVNTIWLIRPRDTIDYLIIGEPLDNTRVFVLDKEDREVKEYEVGEIMIACPHVSPGYWKDEENSKKTFAADEEFGMLYFTGDSGRLLPGGQVEFMGRQDSQVKIRGFRIELGEIESRLLKHPNVREAVVAARELDITGSAGRAERREDTYLCAYIVPHKTADEGQGTRPVGAGLAPAQSAGQPQGLPLHTTYRSPVPLEGARAACLRTFLSQTLPDYMSPTYFVTLDRLPLTQSGKIDRKALPDPERGAKARCEAPRNPVEKKMADIWHTVLGVEKEKIGIDADFFELGGHSLRGITMLSKVHREFNVRIPVAELFRLSTVRALAGHIRKAGSDMYVPIEPVGRKEYYALSPMQKRLFLLNEIEGIHTAYNMKTILQVIGKLDLRLLEKVFGQLIERHESLRTSFGWINDEPVQQVHDPGDIEFNIEYYETGSREKRRDRPVGGAYMRPESIVGARSAVLSDQGIESIIGSFIRPFDLAKAPSIRVGVIRTGEERHVLIVDAHHMVFDGTSVMILLREFVALYSGEELAPVPLHYKDYAECLTGEKKRASVKAQEAYWLEQFAGEIPMTELPCDYRRPAVQSFAGNSLNFSLSAGETELLRELCVREGVTMYMVLLSALNLLLAKLSGREDIVVGTGVAGRNHVEVQDTIGIFVNTLTIRNYPRTEKRFSDFLHEVKERTLQAFANREYQFEDLVDSLNIKRDVGRNPLFDVMFVFQNMEFAGVEIPGLRIMSYPYERNTAIIDLNVQAYEDNGELKFHFSYCTDLFKEETIKRFACYFKRILSFLSRDMDEKLANIEILSPEEKRQLLYDFNDTQTGYPEDKTIPQLFEEQAARTPAKTAVVGMALSAGAGQSRKPVHITYRELDRQAGEMAAILIEKGIMPEEVVGIMVERSIEMIVGLFAILKAGAAYLPIGPGSPEMRIGYMLKDSSANFLLTATGCDNGIGSYKNLQVERIFIEETGNRSYKTHTSYSVLPGVGACLAYVIYTSGSTGKPKGVMIEHHSVVNRLYWMQKEYPLTGGDTILQKTTYTFDVSVWELFWWSFFGARLCLLEPGGEKDPAAIIDAVARHRVTAMHFVPSMLDTFLHYLDMQEYPVGLSALRRVFASGEALKPDQVEKFYRLLPGVHGWPVAPTDGARQKVAAKGSSGVEQAAKLINLYGPTEATVDVSYFDCYGTEKRDRIPIGKPIDNTGLYILDKALHVQPIGTAGELFIGGVGLARGYLNNPELTAEKFRSNFPGLYKSYKTYGSYSPLPEYRPVGAAYMRPEPGVGARRAVPGEFPSHGGVPQSGGVGSCTLYKTGDLARWLPDGNIEFLGRIDHQLKIRGFRIELGEIEEQLTAHEDIKEAVVLPLTGKGEDTYLCAYIVAKGISQSAGQDESITAVLREYLSRLLPGYMIPSYFVQIEKIPLTPNGKIDRKALPAPEIKSGREYAAPRNMIERELVEIWSEVLNIEASSLGIDDDFFEMGGHSLRAAVMILKIQKELDVRIPMSVVFKTPNIRSISTFIKGAVKEEYTSVEPAEKKEYYSASVIQERLYIVNEIEGIDTAYNMKSILQVEGKLDYLRMEKAFEKLIRGHESLRTSFELIDDKPVQRIHDPGDIDFKIEYLETGSRQKAKGNSEKHETIPVGGAYMRPNPDVGARRAVPSEKEIESIIDRFIRPFDLSKAPLLRVGWIKVEEEKHILVRETHHIISDGTSQVIFLRELLSLYEEQKLSVLKIQYKDFVEWQAGRRQQEVLKKQEEYWLRLFKDRIPEVENFSDFPRPKVQDFAGDFITMEFDEELTRNVNGIVRAAGATLYMVLLAVYNVLLFKYTGREDIVIGTPTAGREHAAFENIIGIFINVLVMRNYPAGGKSFAQFLNEVKTNTMSAYENQGYSFGQLVEKLGAANDISRNPIYDMELIVQNMDIPKFETKEIRLSPYPGGTNVSQVDGALYVTEFAGKINFRFIYSTALFKRSTMERFLAHFKEIVLRISDDREIKLQDIELSHDLQQVKSDVYSEMAADLEF